MSTVNWTETPEYAAYKALEARLRRPRPNGRTIAVRARKIVEALWKTAEEYHASAIDYAEFSRRNRASWDTADTDGLRHEVARQLRRSA